MTKLVVAAIVALLIGAIITELHFRVFPEQHFVLFVLCVIGVFLGGVVGARVSGATALRQPAASRAKDAGANAAGASAKSNNSRRQPRREAKDNPRQRSKQDNDSAPAAARAPAKKVSTGAKPTGNGRESGEVKWFNRNKGFGFIIRDNGGEIFVHQRSLSDPSQRSLRDGQRVTFDVVDHEKGLQAESVTADED